MEKDWVKKVHTFRLKKEDEELYLFLESVPKMKKSEVVRNMLLFALKYMNDSDDFLKTSNENTSNIIVLLEDLKDMLLENEQVNNEIKEEIKEIKNKTSFNSSPELSNDENKTKQDEEDPSTKNTVDAMFNVFGVNFE